MRRISCAVFCVVFLLALRINTNAHPGNTDGKGGHHDRSSGEYHYHHGYSAHQHTDMDGDGVLDCPYEFDNKTNHQPESNSSTYDWSYEPIVIPTFPDAPTVSDHANSHVATKQSTFPGKDFDSGTASESGMQKNNAQNGFHFDFFDIPFYLAFIAILMMFVSQLFVIINENISTFLLSISFKLFFLFIVLIPIWVLTMFII